MPVFEYTARNASTAPGSRTRPASTLVIMSKARSSCGPSALLTSAIVICAIWAVGMFATSTAALPCSKTFLRRST